MNESLTKKDYNTTYYQEHKEELKAHQREYNKTHREDQKAYAKKHRQECKEQVSASEKKHYQKYKEEHKSWQHEYNQEHREDQKMYSKNYRQEHEEEVKAMEKQRSRTPERIYANYRYSAAERGIEFNLSKERFLELLAMPCAFAEIDGERCGNSRGEQRVGIDRLSNGAYEDHDVIPLCHYHNTIKGAITPQMIELLYKLCTERGILNFE
jgi:hypothetical protein